MNNGNPVTVPRLDVHTAKEALGIQKRPDGKMKEQVQYLRAKTVKWRDAVRTRRVNAYEAWYCLNSTIMKSIEYCLMATTISESEMTHIMAPVLETLTSLKIQRKLARALVYGTHTVQGIGIKNPPGRRLQ
jgi:hypothetical protein